MYLFVDLYDCMHTNVYTYVFIFVYKRILSRGDIWGLYDQKEVSQAGISDYVPQYALGCNYLSLPEDKWLRPTVHCGM